MPEKMSRYWFRYRLRTLFVTVSLLGAWLGIQVNWIQQRHELLVSGRIDIMGPDWNDRVSQTWPRAPGGLWLLGEQGIHTLGVNAEWESRAHAKLLQRAHSLFPEAEILDFTYSTVGAL